MLLFFLLTTLPLYSVLNIRLVIQLGTILYNASFFLTFLHYSPNQLYQPFIRLGVRTLIPFGNSNYSPLYTVLRTLFLIFVFVSSSTVSCFNSLILNYIYSSIMSQFFYALTNRSINSLQDIHSPFSLYLLLSGIPFALIFSCQSSG